MALSFKELELLGDCAYSQTLFWSFPGGLEDKNSLVLL